MKEALSGDPMRAARLAEMLDEVIDALDEAGHQSAACHVDHARHLVMSDQAKTLIERWTQRVSKLKAQSRMRNQH